MSQEPSARRRYWRHQIVIGHLAAAAIIASTATAQEQVVERNAKGLAAKEIRVGVYLNVQPDCTSGAINIKHGKVSATNYKQCLALEVPGFVAFYKSKPDFSGVDTATLEVKYPGGRTEVQKIKVTIGDGKEGQKI